jgi:hypothetical protein
MFEELIEQLTEALTETVRKDITNYRPTMVRKGRETLLANPGLVSNNKLKKWGYMPTYHDRQTAKMKRRYDLMMAKSKRDRAAKKD